MSAQASFALRGRNPDVLTCIANLSNDEVFTPPELANQMLNTLAEAWQEKAGGSDIWADKTVRFLDPCTKSGVFLREITSRLNKGLATEIPNLDERVNDILTKQVFGIGITYLTSLLARRSVYCSKHANGPHSITKGFRTEAGNIWFERMEHTWEGKKCAFGAPTHSRSTTVFYLSRHFFPATDAVAHCHCTTAIALRADNGGHAHSTFSAEEEHRQGIRCCGRLGDKRSADLAVFVEQGQEGVSRWQCRSEYARASLWVANDQAVDVRLLLLGNTFTHLADHLRDDPRVEICRLRLCAEAASLPFVASTDECANGFSENEHRCEPQQQRGQ
jgi:hypothetical protein